MASLHMQQQRQQVYGDDRVHFDPVRAVQSIKLSNNYCTAKSNDNFLSTVVLNTYFFNNTVLHHDDIKQAPPTFNQTEYISSASSSELSDDASSCSSDYSSNDDDEESADSFSNSLQQNDENSHFNQLHSHTFNLQHQLSTPQINTNQFAMQRMTRSNTSFVHRFKKRSQTPNNILFHTSSTPDPPNNRGHHKSATMQTAQFIPAQLHHHKKRHRANPNKASQILGINSDAVILANHRLKQHRKSQSFSSMLLDNNDNESKNENEDTFEMMDDNELIAEKLKFDAFKSQKRNTGRGSGHISRSQTVDLTNSPKLTSLHLTVNDEHDRIIQQQQRLQQQKRNMRRNRLSVSRQVSNGNNEASDMIEITLRIDQTKKGYLFIGIIPCNKINDVVQPGFMFGFNSYSYSFHGYSGKIYHDKLQSDYCFSSNNTSAAKKKQNAAAKNRAHSRSNTVDITLSASTRNGNGFGRSMHASFDSSDHITESKENNNVTEQKDESDQLLPAVDRNGGTKKSKKDKKGNHKLPVLKSGDIVTLKMKLNRNNGKFAVIYAVNEVDYGVAWKGIDPPVTVGITMVGRQEQITLLSCNYKPSKNDKSCVIL